MLLAANFAFSGQLAWTPGGYGIAFGRMLQDGIVKRFLDEHCPDARLKLCPYRNQLPNTADEFLWNYGIFNELGRFAGLGEEMRFIVLRSLEEYPLQQIKTALAATAINSAWSPRATGRIIRSGIRTVSSSVSSPRKCLPCRKLGNSMVSSISP